MQKTPFTRWSAPVRANAGLILCGFAGLALWLVALFVPEAVGPVLGRMVVKPTAVQDAGPTWFLLLLFVPYAAAYFFASRRSRSGDREVIALFAALYCMALVIRYLPMASYDLYLYVFQGRAAAMHGLNPYAIVPADVADPFVQFMGRWLSGLKNTYGPLWTSLAVLLAAAAGDRPVAQIVAFKAFAAALFLGCIPLVAALGRESGDRRTDDGGSLLLFAWNPALLFELVQNGHNDVAMIFFLLLALLLAVRRRLAWSGAALAASFTVKYMTVLCLPFFVAYAVARAGDGMARKLRAALSVLAPAAAVTAAAFAPYWFGPGTLEGLASQSSLVGVDVSSPFAFAVAFAVARGPAAIFAPETMDATTRPALLAFATVAALLVAAAFRRPPSGNREFLRFAFAPLAAYLGIASFWFMPWYLSWIAPFIVLEGAAFTALVAGVTGILLYYAYFTGPLLGAAMVVAAAGPVAASFASSKVRAALRRA